MIDKNKTFIQKFSKDYDSIIKELYQKNMIRDVLQHSIIKTHNQLYKISRNQTESPSNILYDKLLPIEVVMNTLLEKKEYNILLYDRSIIQYDFIIKDGKIIKERLIFIKKHNYLWSQDEIIEKDMNEFEIDWFTEERGIPIVIRIDFDEQNHIDVIHPSSHMTLSNYDECRIPMMGPVSLYDFLNFILNFFYNDGLSFKSRFEEKNITITEDEKKRIHFEW